MKSPNDPASSDKPKFNSQNLVVPILIMTFGSGWLLTTMGLAPNIAWVWTLGLGAAGVLTFVISGFDKFSVVLGPFLMGASFFSLLRQSEMIPLNIEIPILVIYFGFLTLVAQIPTIPVPKWFHEE